MQITSSGYSIGEIKEMLERKDLIVNREYQRGSRLWPPAARSYFIDTILTGFPFPKIYFYEFLVEPEKKIKRELVDGQQRVSSIIDFINGDYAITSVSTQYKGRRFRDLDDEEQSKFIGYSVQVDVIRNASKSDILEMFRRMNAYTLPLNAAEKRHSGYQGKFKWAINRLATKSTLAVVEFGIFSKRQIVRMADAELYAEMALALEKGVVSSSAKMLSDLYGQYDDEFDKEDEYIEIIADFFSYLLTNFGELRSTMLAKPYVIHSLFCAAMLNLRGLPNAQRIAEIEDINPIGSFGEDRKNALESLRTLAMAHEEKDVDGDLKDYVRACLKGTNRVAQRATRIRYLAYALRGDLIGG
ncbi:MAG: DUF262 domain-containing protein [Planctomycetota bacterium]